MEPKMKLILCKQCTDVVRLFEVERRCKCGAVGGRYLDGLNAEYWGDDAVPIGFHNALLLNAIANQPYTGMGKNFEAFVIPRECGTMKKVGDTDVDQAADVGRIEKA
jgi:hypothetical protein